MAYHRLHMTGVDDPTCAITAYVPLTSQHCYDPDGHKPHLLKAVQDGEVYFGELVLLDGAACISWEFADYKSETDLLGPALRVGRLVQVCQRSPETVGIGRG